MSERRNRFLSLEKPRDASAASQVPPLDAPPPARAPSETQSGEGEAAGEPGLPADPAQARLRAERDEMLKSGLALEAEPAGAQPFVRCGRCETDASRFETHCRTCGADLDSPDQRAFNENLWAERRLQTELEAQAEVQRIQERAERVRAEQEALTEASKQHEREDLRTGAGSGSFGSRLLHLIPDARVRLATSIVVLGVGLYSLYRWASGPRAQGYSGWAMMFLVICASFIPRTVWWGTSRPRRWW